MAKSRRGTRSKSKSNGKDLDFKLSEVDSLRLKLAAQSLQTVNEGTRRCEMEMATFNADRERVTQEMKKIIETTTGVSPENQGKYNVLIKDDAISLVLPKQKTLALPAPKEAEA